MGRGRPGPKSCSQPQSRTLRICRLPVSLDQEKCAWLMRAPRRPHTGPSLARGLGGMWGGASPLTCAVYVFPWCGHCCWVPHAACAQATLGPCP